ncbi:MAG: hypothetical protein IPG32_13610 [Saprospirales bacterium]|nr:hypothetical protein [Saprospirales bacterium]
MKTRSFYPPPTSPPKCEIDWQHGTDAKEEKGAGKNEAIAGIFLKSNACTPSTFQLLKAHTLFERDEEYVVIEGQVNRRRADRPAYDGRAPLFRRAPPGPRSQRT